MAFLSGFNRPDPMDALMPAGLAEVGLQPGGGLDDRPRRRSRAGPGRPGQDARRAGGLPPPGQRPGQHAVQVRLITGAPARCWAPTTARGPGGLPRHVRQHPRPGRLRWLLPGRRRRAAGHRQGRPHPHPDRRRPGPGNGVLVADHVLAAPPVSGPQPDQPRPHPSPFCTAGTIEGGIGHDLPQQAPGAFADAMLKAGRS
jgi:hypothetical protein